MDKRILYGQVRSTVTKDQSFVVNIQIATIRGSSLFHMYALLCNILSFMGCLYLNFFFPSLGRYMLDKCVWLALSLSLASCKYFGLSNSYGVVRYHKSCPSKFATLCKLSNTTLIMISL